MINVISSFIASDCSIANDQVQVRNPGRYLISSSTERQRLETLGRPYVQLPELVAVLTLMSDTPGPFPYRLSCVFVYPDGERSGGLLTTEYAWPDGKRFDRVNVRLQGQIPFFATGGVYKVRFLCNGVPLCEIPLPIFWDDDLATEPSESRAAS